MDLSMVDVVSLIGAGLCWLRVFCGYFALFCWF
jgi:hypothetical protein